MYPISTRTTGAALLVAYALTGCATSKEEVLPHGPATMLDVWEHAAFDAPAQSEVPRQLRDARKELQRSPSEVHVPGNEIHSYTRTASKEIYRQFHRLPNPDLVMFVFPHLAGTDPVPVPGYSTVFPFYQRVQYAMPGERTEEY